MLSYVVPISSELLDLVNNEISPFVEKFTYSDLDIMSINSDGSVSSSTGHVEDSKAALPPVKPAKPAETEPVEDPVINENGNVVDPNTGAIIFDPSTGETIDPDTSGSGGQTGQGTGGSGVTEPENNGGGTQTGEPDPGTETGGETGPGTETGGEPEQPVEPAGSTEPAGGDAGSSGGDTGGIEWVLPGQEPAEPPA